MVIDNATLLIGIAFSSASLLLALLVGWLNARKETYLVLGAILGAGIIDSGLGYGTLPLIGAVTSTLAALVAIGSSLLERNSDALPPLPAAAE